MKPKRDLVVRIPRWLLAGIRIADIERVAIEATLEKCDGNRTHAAKVLGISLRTLQRKLRQYAVLDAACQIGERS